MGDLIFLSGAGWRSGTVRLWQRLVRRLTPYERSLGISHIAVVIGGGIAMHATTVSTKRQSLSDLLAERGPARNLRILRRTEPLTEMEGGRLAQAVQRHDRQPYTIGIGLLGRLWRDMVRRGAALTLPNCSELATLGYAAIGIDLAQGLRASEALPIDLFRATAGEGWTEVADLYYPPPMASAYPDGSPIDWPEEPDLSLLTEAEHLLGEGRYEQFHAAIDLMDHQEALAALFEQTTLEIMADPVSSLINAPDAAAALIEEGVKVFDWAAAYPASADASPIMDGIAGSFLHVDLESTPFEGRPTFSELQMRERTLNAADVIRRAMRMAALVTALDEICREAATLSPAIHIVLSGVQPLSEHQMLAVKGGLTRLALVAPDFSETLTRALLAHENLSIHLAGFHPNPDGSAPP